MSNYFEKLTQQLLYSSSGNVSANFTIQTMILVYVDMNRSIHIMERMGHW